MKRFVVAAGLFAALALWGSAAQAQSGAVRGRVVDDKGQPLQDVKVEIEYLGNVTRKLATKTSKKGEFTQVGLPPGDYKVTVTKEGFQGGYITLHVGLGEPTQVPEFKLQSQEAAAKTAGASKADQVSGAFKAAYELMNQGKVDEAEAAFEDILAKTPDIPEVYYNLAFIAGQKKDWATAEAHYRKAVELKPDFGDAWVALAQTYGAMGQADKGFEVMTKAAADNPSDAKLQFNLGVFFVNTGRSAEAKEAFEKAEKLDPDNAEVHYHLGTIAVGQNDIPGAIAHLEKYLAANPSNAQNVGTAQGLLQYLKPKPKK